jgi:hypothetical protein
MANYKTTIGETTFQFFFNKEETFNYGGKNDVTLETEIFDLLINGRKSIYSVQFDTKLQYYTLWSNIPDSKGGIFYRELMECNGKSGFPMNVVLDILKSVDTHWVR